MSNKFVFIIGVGRSGTTLLQSILHSHPAVHFTPESHFVKKYLSKETSANSAVEEITRLIENIRIDETLNQISTSLSGICDDALNRNTGEDKIAWIFEQILKEKSGAAIYLGDKDPMNVNYLGLIRLKFPDSKIIHIIRDPRDVVLSRMKSTWGKDSKMVSHVAEYQHGVRKAQIDGNNFFHSNYTEVRYEELIKNPKSTSDKICSFLNIQYDPAMLNHQNSSKELLRSDEGDWKSNVLQPVLSTNSEKWRTEFSLIQIEKIEYALKDTLKELGYLRSTNKHGLKERLFFLIVGIYRLAFTIRFN